MAVLITGGAGFIGAATAEIFADAGYEVVAFDRALPTENARLRVEGRGVRYVFGDMRERGVVRALVRETGSDPIIHLAGILTGGCDRDPDAALAVNVLGMRHLLQAVVDFEPRRVVFSSTIAVYGPGLPQPITEDMPTEPDGWYGLTKVMAERMGMLYTRRHGLDFRALRFAAATGPGRTAGSGSATLWTSLIPEKAALGEPYTIEVEPDVSCPLVYVKDAARSLFALATAPNPPRRIYNIASGNVVASDLVAAVRARFPESELSYKPDPVIMGVMRGVKEWRIDCAAAAEDLGWRPTFDVTAMVDDIIATARASR